MLASKQKYQFLRAAKQKLNLLGSIIDNRESRIPQNEQKVVFLDLDVLLNYFFLETDVSSYMFIVVLLIVLIFFIHNF